MPGYVVIVADAARARVFTRNKKFSPLEEHSELTHPEARLRRQDLVSDRPGTVHESKAYGESPAGESTDPKDHEVEVFAGEIAEHLGQQRIERDPEGLIVVAEPRVLGLIRQKLDAATAALVTTEISANLTRESAETIAERIDA
ncbi:host attachment protein [Wenzhouxiangella limi]|uniref:host attachment protein n=1 Tax=Wenzhouxiangella limi TaxID=2707351 RepID=UPI001942A22D|nr:host attachment protein [Wenzhouxiangella limi]